MVRTLRPGGAAVDRLDRQPMLGEKQRVTPDTAAEIERCTNPAPLQLG